ATELKVESNRVLRASVTVCRTRLFQLTVPQVQLPRAIGLLPPPPPLIFELMQLPSPELSVNKRPGFPIVSGVVSNTPLITATETAPPAPFAYPPCVYEQCFSVQVIVWTRVVV